MEKKRLGIFLFDEYDGKAKRYTEYILKSLRPLLKRLIVITKDKTDDETKALFKAVADDVIETEKTGGDAAAWQKGIVEICGKDELEKYDSLVLLNNSFFGPFYPFEDIFSEMEEKELDFWGITIRSDEKGKGLCPYGYCPKHIQPYFTVYESELLRSGHFYDFWRSLPVYTKPEEIHEYVYAVITKHFEDIGYKWDVLCNTSVYDQEEIAKNFNHHIYNLFDLIVNMRCPVILRQSFDTDKTEQLSYSNGAELYHSIEYVEERYDYDVSMITEYLAERYSPYRIKSSLCLDYVLSDYCPAPSLAKGEAVVIAHLVYDDIFEKYINYLKNIPEEIDVVITTNSDEKRDKLKAVCGPYFGGRLEIRVCKNRGRDIAALLVVCHDILKRYKFLCFVHDKKSSHREYMSVGYEFDRIDWENMLRSRGYIYNIAELLKKHKYLGLLTPFGVHHGSYYNCSINYWLACRQIVPELAERLGIPAPDTNEQLIAVGTCFWCRTDALSPLFDYDFVYEDFPEEPLPNDGTISHAIERIFPFAAAHKGYLSGWVYTEDYARTELFTQRFQMENLVREMLPLGMNKQDYRTYRDLIFTTRKLVKAMDQYRSKTLKQRIKSITPMFVLRLYGNTKRALISKAASAKGLLRALKLKKECRIVPNKIVFRAFQDKYACNPKYICDEIIRRGLPYDIVWINKTAPEFTADFPEQVRIVKLGSPEAEKEIYSAKVLINNGAFFFKRKIEKKKKQIGICTWHGSMGFKKNTGNKLNSKNVRKAAALYNSTNDYVVSNSAFEDEIYRTSYWPSAEILRYGHPRNDILFCDDTEKEKIKAKVRKALNIPDGMKILLYGPTFREKLVDDGKGDVLEYEPLDLNMAVKALSARFGGSWYVIYRDHFVNTGKKRTGLPEHCCDGTKYTDMQELMIAADAAITDYSSWILDYMLTHKPAFLYAPDMERYDFQRGFYYPLTEAPFSIAESNDEMSEVIKNFNNDDYQKRIAGFLADKGCIEEGAASKRVVDFITQVTGIGQ